MTIFYACSTDHYGEALAVDDAPANTNSTTITWNFDDANFLSDSWAYEPTYGNGNFRYRPAGTYAFTEPSWGARKGERALVANGPTVETESDHSVEQVYGDTACMPLVIPGNTSTVRRVHFAFGCSELATSQCQSWLCSLLDSNSNPRVRLRVNSAGRIEVYDGATMEMQPAADPAGGGFLNFPTLLASSQSTVFEPDTWYSVNMQITTNPSDATMDLEIWVGEITAANKVIDISGIAATDWTGGNFGAETNVDIIGFLPKSLVYTATNPEDNQERAVRDIVLSDSSGTYNTDMLGQVFVSVQDTRFEDAGGGWTAHPRDNLGTGVLDDLSGNGAYVADNAAFELGAGEFTIEGDFRLDSIPESGEWVFFSKWDASNNERSYKLVWDTTLDTLRWIISTDGTAETVVWEYPVQDIMDFRKWYNLAVCREVVSGVGTTRVFIDGTQYGVDVTDSNTYDDNGTPFGLGGAFETISGVETILEASAFEGYMDEFRFTKGVARYTTDFTVATEKFGRNNVDDTDYDDVSLLLGFDASLLDESSNVFTVNYGTDVTYVEPDDDDYSFSVLTQAPPVDDSYIEAKQGRATAVLTLTGQPLDTETVTLGSVTYTFQTVLVDSANNVLIGADTEESLQNLQAAIQAGAGAGTVYGSGTSANVDVIGQAVFDPQGFYQAQSLGASGNSLASTETLTNGSFYNGATFTGGSDIPGASDFAMERLPAEVTGVLAVQFTGRAYKSDAGAAQVRFDLVGPSAAVGTGDGLDTDLSPSWVRQIHEEDPDTSATITPSTIVGGRVRVTRTT